MDSSDCANVNRFITISSINVNNTTTPTQKSQSLPILILYTLPWPLTPHKSPSHPIPNTPTLIPSTPIPFYTTADPPTTLAQSFFHSPTAPTSFPLLAHPPLPHHLYTPTLNITTLSLYHTHILPLSIPPKPLIILQPNPLPFTPHSTLIHFWPFVPKSS